MARAQRRHHATRMIRKRQRMFRNITGYEYGEPWHSRFATPNNPVKNWYWDVVWELNCGNTYSQAHVGIFRNGYFRRTPKPQKGQPRTRIHWKTDNWKNKFMLRRRWREYAEGIVRGTIDPEETDLCPFNGHYMKHKFRGKFP